MVTDPLPCCCQALPLVLGATGAALTVPKVSLPLLARSELLPLAVMGTSGAVIDVVAEAGTCTSGPPLFLGHFSPIFPRFFPIFSPFSPSCRQDSGNRHQDPEKRSVTVENGG